MHNEARKCPVCGKPVLSVEGKCRHCGAAIENSGEPDGSVERGHTIVLCQSEKSSFQEALDYAKDFCAKHRVLIGVGEMALGAALITWGLQTGHIQLGKDVVASRFSEGGLLGGTAGAGIGALAGNLIGAIGIVPFGGIAIPAIAMISGGAAIFGAFGYSIGDIAAKFSAHTGGFDDLLLGASALTVGVALLLDGARRIAKDDFIRELASKFVDGVVYLTRRAAEGTVSTWDEVRSILKHPVVSKATFATTAGVGMLYGASVGGGIAASSVTVLGSHALGAAALSFGLVSAPLWPVFAGGAVGLALVAGSRKAIQHYFNQDGPR